MENNRCCAMYKDDPILVAYHDHEWCKINHEDRFQFEMLCLEGASTGLSWKTIMHKREAYKKAYHFFDIESCAAMTDFYKLRIKNYNATFGYYTRLKVRLHKMQTILNKEYKDYILDGFVQEIHRKDINMEQAANINADIEELASNAKETLLFLKKEDEQMPASEDWNQYYNVLLDFLEDCERIVDAKYYKWESDISNNKENYYKLHNENLKK